MACGAMHLAKQVRALLHTARSRRVTPAVLQLPQIASTSKSSAQPNARRQVEMDASSKYASAHAAAQGPGDARPTALQIVRDEGLEGKLNDVVVLITGGTNGIGLETARAMCATGAQA
jgi:hypothetical protein